MEPAGKRDYPDSTGRRSGVPTDASPVSASRSSGKARWHSTAMRSGVILIVMLLIAVGSGIYYLMHRQHGSPTANNQVSIVWQPRATGLTAQDKQGIDDALVAAASSEEPALPTSGHSGRPELLVIHAARSGPWAILNIAVRMSPTASVAATEPVFFIAQRLGASWSLTSTSSAHFCQRLHQLPPGLQGPADDRYFGC